MKTVKIFGLLITLLTFSYLLGPTMPDPVFNQSLPSIEGNISLFVDSLESSQRVRPGNEARIVWANDSLCNRTDFVLLYLHGFSASWYEGFPVNVNFSKRYHCNAYFARLVSHGLITNNPLIDMTPGKLYESAKQALVIAHKLGEKVIIMGTSTGASLGLMLAADFPELVNGLILYSPNIRIKQNASLLLSKPWGLQIARLSFGGDFRETDDDKASEICKYWYCSYCAEATVYLQQLLNEKMNKAVFQKVNCPVFMGYYYKDQQHQDQIVSVSAALKMFDQLGTDASQKKAVAFPEAGAHVIACKLKSCSVDEVEKATWNFTELVIKRSSNYTITDH